MQSGCFVFSSFSSLVPPCLVHHRSVWKSRGGGERTKRSARDHTNLLMLGSSPWYCQGEGCKRGLCKRNRSQKARQSKRGTPPEFGITSCFILPSQQQPELAKKKVGGEGTLIRAGQEWGSMGSGSEMYVCLE